MTYEELLAENFRLRACIRELEKDAKEKDVIGIYPILEDNRVYFLCADFDDKNCERGYLDEVLSYVCVCKDWGIPVYIERSRSGKGAPGSGLSL